MRQTSMKKSMNLIWVVGIPKIKGNFIPVLIGLLIILGKKTCFLINNLNSSHGLSTLIPKSFTLPSKMLGNPQN